MWYENKGRVSRVSSPIRVSRWENKRNSKTRLHLGKQT